MKVALGNGNSAPGIYCLVVTQANYSIVVYAQMSNAQSPMTNQAKASFIELRV